MLPVRASVEAVRIGTSRAGSEEAAGTAASSRTVTMLQVSVMR